MISRALQAIRTHLGMDVAYVSEFVGDRTVFREVDAPGLEALIKPGDSRSLDDVYCRHILAGRLPEAIPDTAKEPLAAALPITAAVPIGSHMSVPIHMPDGRLYGMFCCLSAKPDPSLNQRDLQMMRVFAELTAFEIDKEMKAKSDDLRSLSRIRSAIREGTFSVVYQPIWNLAENRPVGLECLTRFPDAGDRSPAAWFAEAADAGLGSDLELAVIRQAISVLMDLPDDVHLAVNASPQTIQGQGLGELLDTVPPERIVLEVTEHAVVDDYPALLNALEPLRARGVRLAVDDAGAGYSGLQHILHLRPDLIKLDMSLTRHIDIDRARRALTAALIDFGHETGSRLVAEGVETASELKALTALGVEKAQGYFLGRPMPFADARDLFSDAGLAASGLRPRKAAG